MFKTLSVEVWTFSVWALIHWCIQPCIHSLTDHLLHLLHLLHLPSVGPGYHTGCEMKLFADSFLPAWGMRCFTPHEFDVYSIISSFAGGWGNVRGFILMLEGKCKTWVESGSQGSESLWNEVFNFSLAKEHLLVAAQLVFMSQHMLLWGPACSPHLEGSLDDSTPTWYLV